MNILTEQKDLAITPLNPTGLAITQVDKTMPPTEGVAINGRFAIPAVDGVDFKVTSSSTVYPISGTDVNSQSFGYLLAAFPMFGYIYFNPLLTPMDIGDPGDPAQGIDFTKTFQDVRYTPPTPPVYYANRLQTGREKGVTTPGNFPTHTALLPANTATTPTRPGLLITKELDISAQTGSLWTDEFCVYWKLFDFSVTNDISSDYGATSGKNEPSIRYLLEVDQEPATFQAWISPDDGAHWARVSRLEPVAFAARTTKIRLAFMNWGASKVYLANYAVMF